MKSKQGIKFLAQEEAGTKSSDYAQKDLYYAIENGDYPGWDFYVHCADNNDCQ